MRSATTPLAIAALVAGIASVACERHTPAGEPPSDEPARAANLLLITLDTTRADALGVYGQALPATPRLDRLAGEGVVFLDCVTSSPSTLPSHATLLTGRQPWAHGVRSNSGYALAEGNVSIAERLRAGGYRTGAEIASAVMARRTGLDQGFDTYRDVRSAGASRKRIDVVRESGIETIELEERAADDITRQGLAFLRASRERPFFLWLHYFDPHRFFAPPEPFRSRFAESPYHGEVAFVDQQLGLVLDELDRLGLRDSTWVVVIGDHGEGLGEHGETSHSFYVYDTTMRVPLVVRGPALSPKRISAPVRSVDVAPTLIDLLGLPPLPHVQGVSLRPLLEGASEDLELAGYGESAELGALFGDPVLRFLREGRWKYIHKPRPELYDVVADPGEREDLSQREPKRVERMGAALRELLAGAPAAPDAAVVLEDATREQLQALGYVAGRAPRGLDDGLAAAAVVGTDPNERLQEVQEWSDALGAHRAHRNDEAEKGFRALWERNPRSVLVLDMLVRSLQQGGRDEEAIPLLRRLIELDPEPIGPYYDLARLSREAGDEPGAADALSAVLGREPCAVKAIASLADLRRAAGDRAAHVQLLAEGVQRCPDEMGLRNDWAWTLATSPNDALRDGPRALDLAQRLVAGDGAGNPAYLDTLAAAHAEVGDFGSAVRSARAAIARFDATGRRTAMPLAFEEHLALFESGQPVREE